MAAVSDEEEERTWARPSRSDVRRVLRTMPPATQRATGTSRLRPEVQDDRDLPDRWPSLAAEIAAMEAGPLRDALRRALEARKGRWLRRWRKPWPLERSDRELLGEE